MPLLPTGIHQMVIRIWNDDFVGHNIGQNDVNVFGDPNDDGEDDRTDSDSSLPDLE